MVVLSVRTRKKPRHSVMKPPKKPHVKKEKCSRRRPWTPKEDEAISQLVTLNGTRQWTLIAEQLNKNLNFVKRTGKQCRERWHNHLNPGINKHPWTLEEELMLFESHQKLGNKWAEIAKHLQGRTDNSIKNHFYSTLRKQFRKMKGTDATRDQLKKYDLQLTSAILATLRKKIKQQKKAETFTQASEEFFDYPESLEVNPPDCPELSPLQDDEMIIQGHHINLPSPMQPFDVEEGPAEFEWTDNPVLGHEVFMMDLNLNDYPL